MGERLRQSYKFPGVGFARDGRRAVGLDDKGRHGQTREGKKEKIKARWRFAKLERIRPTCYCPRDRAAQWQWERHRAPGDGTSCCRYLRCGTVLCAEKSTVVCTVRINANEMAPRDTLAFVGPLKRGPSIYCLVALSVNRVSSPLE